MSPRPLQQRPGRRPNEVSAGGVVARLTAVGWEFVLVRAGRFWGLPKGRLEDGETPRQAAFREISEECGIPLDRLTLVADLAPSEYVYRRDGRLIFKVVHQFVVTVPPNTGLVPQAEEIAEAAWLTLEAALHRASFDATRAALTIAATALPHAAT